MYKSLKLPILLVCLLFIPSSWAGDFPLAFEAIDQNADGFISAAEVTLRKDLEQQFKEVDKDGDGQLSLTEYQAYEGKGRYAPPEETETPEIGAAPVY